MADVFSRETALPGQPDDGAGAAALVLAVCWGRGMFRHSPHFVYKSAQKAEDMVAGEQSKKRRKKLKKMIDKEGKVCYDSEALAGSKSVAPSRAS